MRSCWLTSDEVCTHNEHVVRDRVLFAHVVDVVGHHHRHVDTAGEIKELLVDLGQLGDVVLLELYIPAIRAEQLAIPVQALQRLGLLPVLEQGGQFSRQAARGADQPFAVLRQIVGIESAAGSSSRRSGRRCRSAADCDSRSCSRPATAGGSGFVQSGSCPSIGRPGRVR